MQSVTVLTSNTRQYGFAAALEGIEEATRAAGFALGVRVVESGTPGDVRDAVERAIEPAGALIVIAYDRAGIAALRAVPPDVPMAAMVETPSGDEAAGKPWVWFDDRKAARDATNYLLGLGHKTVHYVSIPSSTSTSQRMLGWRSALEDAGVSVPKPLQAGWDPQSSSQAAQHRLTRDPKVTAVLCGNDDLAIGVMRAMHQAGARFPTTSASSASTTRPSRRSTFPPSRPSARTSRPWAKRASQSSFHCWMRTPVKTRTPGRRPN